MSATVMNIPVTEPVTAKLTEDQNEIIKSVKCECCGLTEECTASYIANIRDRYIGKWICGLCSEAVKDEVLRSQRLITTEEALNKHMMFRNKFSGPPPTNPAVELVFVMRRILRKSIGVGSARSMPSSPRKRGLSNCKALVRSGSCIPSLSLEDDDVADDDVANDDVAGGDVAGEGKEEAVEELGRDIKSL